MSIMETIKNKKRDNFNVFKLLLGGMLGMIVAMGIGRFSFTPILPLMQRDLGMSHAVAGWLAGLNYLGYFVGSICCSLAPQLLRSQLFAGAALLLSIITTLCMGVTLSVFWWGALRLGGGFASAILFVVISVEVGEALARRGYGHWAGALFSGVGIGIALSGLIVPQLDKAWGWNGSWIGMGVLGMVLAAAGIAIGRKREFIQPITVGLIPPASNLQSIRWLAVAYFFEGLGYIVTATFIVAIVVATPGLESFAAYSWVVIGLAAIPSTILWPLLARRIGNKRALLAAYFFQAAGIFLSINADTVFEVVIASVAFGGTFLGIVALTLAECGRRMSENRGRAIAVLTASFGIGQMLGPVLAGLLADLQKGFALSLSLAAICVLFGGVFIALDRHYLSCK